MEDRDKLIEALAYDLRAAIAKHTSLSGDEVYAALGTVSEDYLPEDLEDLDEDEDLLDDEEIDSFDEEEDE